MRQVLYQTKLTINNFYLRSILDAKMEAEIWKQIPDCAIFGNYLVSSYGRIKNKKTNEFKVSMLNSAGFVKYFLYNKNMRATVLVHQLVAKMFISNPNNETDVVHIDGNKLNNHMSNLRWCSLHEQRILYGEWLHYTPY